MAGTISFSGLSASGLDTSSWVDALVSVKQQTITSLEQQKAEKENLLSIVNNIKSYFSSFQTCLQKITDSQYGIASMDLFMQNLALSSNSSIATATATTEAARQSYDVAVDSLATATKATSGYSQVEVKTADLNTTFGTLGGKNGTITVNSQSFNVTTEDTLQNLIDKFKNVGVDAKFDENKGTFTIGMDLDKIDEGATNLKNALRLANNNVSGAVSGSVVYANRNTEFYKLGLNGGDINIEGVKHTITKNGNDYTIQKDGGTAVQMNTLGEFLDYLKSSAVGADDATVDAKGHITIKGATLDKVEGGTNLMDVLNLIESQKRTVSESGALSYIEVRVADLNTKLSALGITGDTTLVAGGTNNTISNDKTLGDIKNILKNAGVDMSVDSRGIITIDTHGNEISGTLLDVLNLDPTKGGTTISSSVHQATLKADGNTKLSELGISSDKKYTAYKSDGTALTTEISNVEGQTVNEFVNALKNSGLDAKFDEKTHQITIKDGYIEGSLADALGMTQLSTSFTENASLNTQLEKLGAIGDSTLTIDGGTAKTYGKDTTLETVFNDIKNAGGKVTFKDGNVTIEGVTLGGSLPSLLGLDATTQGTSVTSGKLTAVTGSTSSGGNTESTVEHNIELSTKLGDITGTTSNYTLKVGDGTSTTYTKDSTLQDIKTQIEAAGGKFTINDDNTISIEGVTMSGTVVGALGFDELATGTKFTTVDAVMISGTSNVATGDTTLGNLGLISGSTSGARAVRRAPANPNKTLSINGGTAKTYGADSSLDDIFADIVAAGGTASINSEGYIVIDGVHLEGTLVDALGLVETSYKTTITSGDLKVTTSTKSTSSSALYTDTKGDIAWDSTIGSIVGDTNSYDLKVNGTNKTYNTNTKLSDIKNVIQAAGGTMTINRDNTISINGVEISGSLVDKLGFNSDGVHTVVSSNNPIYYTDGKKSADTGTTFEQLGISSSKRDYAIYKNDGTEVKASSTNGTSSGKTIGDWLRIVNDSLNTANGTSDITYATINNGVISITGGYVTGSLPTELGIGTKETVTGITMEGSSVSYVEYDPLKYIGNTQTGSGIAAGTMVTSGFMTEAMQYKDEFGNIYAVTETTKLSEVLDSGLTIASNSYTLNVGSYTKTFDTKSTTLGDIVNYVNNLNMDTTYDTTTSATLVGGKLAIESNVDITGSLLNKLGFEERKISSVAYEIKGEKIKLANSGSTGTTTSTTIKELMGKGGSQTLTLTPTAGGSAVTLTFNETDTIQTVIDKLKAQGIDEADLTDGIFRIKDDKQWTLNGASELVNKLFGGDDRTYSAEGPKVTYQVTHSSIGSYTGNKITYTTTTTGSAGSVTGNQLTYTTTTTTTPSGKTYSGDVVKTIAKGYSKDTKLVDINSDYNGKICTINIPKGGSTSGSTGTGLNSGSGNELGGSSNNTTTKPSGSVGTTVGGSTGSNNISLQRAILTINENTTIQDVENFYNQNGNSYASALYDAKNGNIVINYKDGNSGTNPFIGNNIGQIAPQIATTSTTLGELTSNLVLGKINVFNNGSEYSLVVSNSKTIQDVLDFFNNTAGCTATFTDGKLTVTGASDLEFRKAASGRTYDMSTLFGGSMPTGTTSTTTATITNTATGSTKMSELGITDFTVNGSALSGITSSSTINDVLAKLKSTYGLSEATISDGKITLKSNSSTTLSGNLIKGLIGKDSVSITASSVTTPASKTGSKITYTTTTTTTTSGKTYSGDVVKTAAKGYSTDTKLVDIDSKYQGSEMYVYEQRVSSSGTIAPLPNNSGTGSGTSGNPLKPLENQNTNTKIWFEKVATLSINSNTTIQDVIEFYKPYLVESSNFLNPNYTYSLADGTLTLKFQTGYSLHGLLSSNVQSNETISFGTTTPTVATTSTTLGELTNKGLAISLEDIKLINNGKEYTFRTSDNTTIQDVLDFLNNTAGCTATFTDGKLTVTGGSDLEFKKPSTTTSNGLTFQNPVYDMSKLFGGSIPTGTASTTTATTTNTATDSTKMSDLGLSPTLKVDGKNITGLSSSSTVGQVLSALKSQYGIDGSISDGKMTLTSSSAHTVSGDVINKFFGSDSISLTPTTTSTGGTTTTQTATGSTKMSELGITDFTVNGSALSGITSNSTINDVLAKLKSTYGLSEATISDGKITLKSNSNTTLSGNLIKGLMGQDSVSITASSVTTPASQTGSKVTYTKQVTTTTETYTPVKSDSEKLVNMVIMNRLGETNHISAGDTLTFSNGGNFEVTSFSTYGDLKRAFQLAGYDIEVPSDGVLRLVPNTTAPATIYAPAYWNYNETNNHGSYTFGTFATVTPSTSTSNKTFTADIATTMSDLGLSPTLMVDGKNITGLSSSSTVGQVLSALKSQYGIDGSISDGKMTLTSSSAHTVSGDVINKFFGSDSISLTPTTTSTGGTTTTHTATGLTTLAQLGVTDFKVNGSALSGITSNSTINDVLSALKSTYNLSEATISDGKVTLKSNGNITLSGNLINRLTGQDSVSLTAKSSKTCSGDVVKTAAKGYSTDTKLVDIDSSYKGNACVVFEQRTVIGGSGVLRPDTDIKPEGSGSSSGGNLNGNTGSLIKPDGGTKTELVAIAKLTIDENTTIQDVIDFYNNYGTCSYSAETGDISTSPNKNYSFFHPFNMSEAGKFNIGKTTPKTATTSTTLGELEGLGVGRVIRVVNNGKEYTSATSKSTTIQDVLDFLNNTAGCTATFTDGKLTVTGGSDLEFKTATDTGMIGPDGTAVGMLCYQMSTLFGGNMTTSTTSSTTGTITTTYTADTTTKLGASGLGLTSFDLQIESLGDAEPISISGLNGESTIGDVFKKLAEKGITASMNNGVITLSSNTEYSLSGTIAKKLFGNDSVDLECKDEIHDFSMTQVSGTKYQYVSRNLTANSGPERVSEVSQLVAGNKYHISSAEDLVALANFVKNGADTTGSIFMFDNDIDMSGVTGFTAIGTLENAFKGTVYGNGHVVNNMTIDAASSPFMGLFGYTNQATIKDIGVINANVTGGAYTGILVGKAENSQISNAYTSGTVTSDRDQIGGLAGEIKNSTATNVYSTADVKGNGNVGGLVGISNGSVIEKAFATGKATAIKFQAGGLIGAMINGGTVKNSYATGDVNGVYYDGGFVGLIEKSSISYTFDTVYSTGRANGSDASGGFVGFVNTGATVNIKNAVYNRSTGVDAIGLKAGSITGNISGKDYEQMIQKSVMQNAGFTEDKGWVYSANSTPIFGNTTVTGGGKTYLDSSITSLTSGSTYYISSLEQLNNLATLVNNGADTSGINFVLDNDIDVSSFTNTISDFKGTFYGNGHSLTGLKMALFGRVTGNAIVRDLALENMSAQGLLANVVSDNSTVDNVYSTGSTKRHAGLIGTLEGNATLKNSYSTANVTTTSLDSAGGLVGSMSDNATIEHCFAKNTITQKTNTLIPTVIGGLVGDVSGGTIKSSYADCVIKAPVRSNISSFGTSTAGGLIGKTSGNVTIENCYATGSRTAEKTDMFIGQNDGNVTSSGNVACTGTIFGIGTTSGFSDGVTFVSNPGLNSQARMEELGFTKDKGWVYYSGKAPMLQGKDTSSAGTEHQIDTKSTLDSICKNRENKTLSVTINGETHSKTFKGSDTVRDVANWLNGIDGVTANVSNSKFNVSGASQDFRVDGELADVLFGNNKTTTKQTITENTDSNGLMVDGGQKKIDNNTTVGQLLGVTSGKYAITYIDDSGNLQSEKFSSDEKLSEVLKYLNNNGFQASIVNGVFTATKDGKIATNISGAIGEKLKGENGTVTNTSSGYKTGQLDASSSTKAVATTKLSDLGIASGSIFIKDNNNNTLGTIQIDNSMTIDDTAQLLANYGFTLGITDGKVTIEGNGTNRIADGTSNLVSQMKLNNWIETKDKLKTDSTVAQMGFGKGSTLGLVLDNKTYNLTFDANATLQDIIDTLGTYGVTASVDNNGKFTASASGNLVLTNELGAYLTKNSAEGYVKDADGYKSKDPLEFKGDKVKLDYDSKVGDILGTGKDGVLRLTLNKDTVVDLTYKADDTMADIIADLKGYGITATIDDGVLKATSNDKTFRLSGEIGKIISGDTPQYDDISTGYVSKDLSYETTNKTNMNNTLKEMGVSSGQIHVLSNDGKIVSTLDVDENYTVAQVKSLLQPFGMTLSVDENGKFTVASAEGYKLSDGTSNMVSKMGLNNWTTSTEKLSGATTLAQMGFKDGADLNLFLDGAVMNVLSFDANQTVDDIIFGLAAYGIEASVNADGQFTATSKSHTFIMSGGLGSYLTKGTGGYVNSDTAYESYKPLVESKDYVETASKGLDYKDIMTEGSTLESLGFAQGGTVRVMLDGKTPYTLQFLATDKVQDVIYALSAYGINAEVKDGRFVAESVNNTFTLTGNLGSYFVEGGAYQNEVTGYESKPLTYETTEKLTNDTKLSDLGITRGDINVIKDGKVADTIHISDDTTIGQLFSAIKPYGMTGEIVTKANGDTSIRISADSDIKLADGTSNVVSGLGLQNVRKGDFEGMKKYWDDDATSGLITEGTLLSTLDRNGFIAQGSLIFNTGEGDDAVQHIINISANETVGSLIKKFNDSGIKATLDDGVIKLTGGLDKLTFTGGTSGLVETIGLDIHNIDKYASSSSALTYEGETHYSASNFANANTTLDIVNATDGNMSIFVDGVKCNIEVKSSDSFADLFKKIKDTVKARTGLDIQAGFKTKDGSISANPTDANNTGIIGLEIEKGHELVVGASNDTTNFATIANLNKTDYNAVTGSRALYRVNVNSLITESGLYRDGDITEGTFKIGDAEFTIDSTTTLASLINQINKNDKAYANAYWDTLAGTLVIESTVTGASLINIEAGTSNFTDIMGFTKTKDGVSALVTDSQTLGQNAVVRINGTTVTSATNVITSDISKIKGLTINLKNVSAGETVTISVEQDKEAIYNAVSDTLDAYNSMMEALGKELADKKSLGGESILKLMRNNLKRLMTSSLTGAYVFKNLASVGISTGEASDKITTNVTSLLIDKDKFMDALNTDSDAVQDLLVGTKANPGIFLQANNIVENSINTDGYFSNMANTLTKSISNIEKKISKNNLAIENYRTKLETKFHNMELTISGLQSAYANILK